MGMGSRSPFLVRNLSHTMLLMRMTPMLHPV
jgi:hypothetical protein